MRGAVFKAFGKGERQFAARVAKKRARHLKQEEEIEKQGSSDELEQEDLMEKVEEQDAEEQEAVISEEELQRLMEEYEQLMRETMQELAQETSMEELADEFAGAVYDMSPEDLEQLKKKHRSDEMREIADADMKYLRAMFNKLERERQALSSGSSAAYEPAGVSLELSGLDMPVETAQMPVMAEGMSIDCSV